MRRVDRLRRARRDGWICFWERGVIPDDWRCVCARDDAEANNFEDKDGKPLNFINNDGFVGEKGESVSALNYAVPVLLGAASIAGVVATLKALA